MYTTLERMLTLGMSIVLANDGSVDAYPRSAVLVRNFPAYGQFADLPVKPVDQRGSPPLLVYVGSVTEDRGGTLYLQLARELLRRNRDFRMKIIGPAEPAYSKRLTALVDEWKLADHVSISARLEFREAMAIAADASIGLCLLAPVPNYTSCLATKILEYMMVGTPVLASDFPHWRPYVSGEGAGRMVDPTNLAAAADAAEQMLSSPSELRTMGERGAAAVRERYNWSTEFAELRRRYSAILGKSAQTR